MPTLFHGALPFETPPTPCLVCVNVRQFVAEKGLKYRNKPLTVVRGRTNDHQRPANRGAASNPLLEALVWGLLVSSMQWLEGWGQDRV